MSVVEIADIFVDAARSKQRVVVRDDHLIILGQMTVQLDDVDAELLASLERFDRVLGILAAAAAVCDHHEIVLAALVILALKFSLVYELRKIVEEHGRAQISADESHQIFL